ncbi:MAG: phosphate propanoyltransferase [Candidatus Rokubacteria bacterium]|nr:phosphate propanoyltransferase [Candidatus Rokubacteria bacterium]
MTAVAVDRSRVEALVREALWRHLAPMAAPAAAAAAPRLIANISARHCHLDAQAVAALFGPGASLTVLKPLYQAGAFAAEETVTIFGPRKQMIANLRILGPLRDACQVELAFSDARFLGIEAPVRLSGDIDGTPGCYLVGPAGGLELARGAIRAARHVHMSPAEAAWYGVAQGERMRLAVVSEQSGTLDDVIVRVAPASKLEVHVDTDEGNAVDLVSARKVVLEKA